MTKSEMMTRAHEMTRACRRPGDDYRATLGLCLRAAWEEARSEQARSAAAVRLTVAAVLQAAEDATTRRAADTAAAARAVTGEQEQARQEQQPETLSDFLRLPGEAQLDMLRKFAGRCPGYAARAVKRMQDPETGETVTVPAPAAWADWMTPRSKGGLELEPWEIAVDTVAAEAWTRLDKQPEDLPLPIILARACRAACIRLSRVYRDAPTNRSRSKTQDGTGAIRDAVSLDDPDYSSAARYPSPETAACERDAIRAAAHDEADFTILDLRAQGYTLQTIAARLGISHPAVIKRLRRMQDRMQDERTRADADALDAAVMAAAGVRQPRRPEWRPDNASSAPGTGSAAAPADHHRRSVSASPRHPERARAW